MKRLGDPYFQILLSASFLTTSELFLKHGASETAGIASKWAWTGINGLASIWVWWGILLMVLSFLSWLYALKHLPLSIAYPLSNIVHVSIPISAWILLGEAISSTRWFGIVLVVLGLIVVAKPVSQIEEKL
jgi:drug/metabolite transporter (DMT)-like permease